MRISQINTIPYTNNCFFKHYCPPNSKNPKTAVPADTVLNFLNCVGTYNIQFGAAKLPFYAISSDGSYKKYTDRKQAVQELSLAKSNIAECLQGKRSSTHGYAFIYSSEIEQEDDSGNVIVNNDKIATIAQALEESEALKDKPIPIYAIDRKGNYRKFPSKYNAAKVLKINPAHINRILNKELKTSKEYTFVFPDEIENEAQNSEKLVDGSKLADVVFSAFEGKSTPIYAVDKNGIYQKFPSAKNAAEVLSLEPANISKCLNGERKRCGNYTFVRADEIETTDTFGDVSIDIDTLQKINLEMRIKDSFVPVYSVSSNGNCKRFESKKHAADFLGINIGSIGQCLLGYNEVVNGYAFVRAEDVEQITPDGEIKLNYDVLKRKYEAANKNSVYAIYKDGHFEKYITQADAARKLNLKRKKISDCVIGIKNRVHGRVFIKAGDVETFKDGKILLNSQLIKKFALELAKPDVKAVYAFDSKGVPMRFSSSKEASKTLSISASCVNNCLSENGRISKGYRFIYAENFEHIDENGNIVVDYEKIDAISDEINPKNKRLINKYGKIFAIKDVNVFEYKDVRAAARAFDISMDEMIFMLENGRNRTNRKNTIKGCVFTSEYDS